VTLIFITVDFLRLRINAFKDIFVIIFGSFLRKRELHSLTGGTYLLLASLLALAVYSKDVVIAAVSFLVIGDTVAALMGQLIGRIRFFRKTLEGTLSGLVACILVALVVCHLPHTPTYTTTLPLGVGILGAVVASVVEALPFEVNDNVIIPILAGAVMQIGKLIF